MTSILTFSQRMSLTYTERFITYMLGLLTAGWTVAFFVMWIIQSWPIRSFWDFDINGISLLDPEEMNLARVVTEAVLFLSVLIFSSKIFWEPRFSQPKWMSLGIFVFAGL